METLLTYLHVVAGGTLVGKVVLLSFVVAPILAKQLDRASFGRVVRQLFPAYYAMGMIAALVGLTALGGLVFMRGLTTSMLLLSGSWLVILSAESYCRAPLTPRSNLMRDQLKAQEEQGAVDPQLQVAWDRLHRRSVYLNSLVLVMGLCVLGVATTWS